jgi:HEAT repeat protein
MICEFLFFEEDGEKKEKINYIDLKIQIRELIKNRFDREVLTAVLLDLRKDVNGKTRTELFRVYQDLELHKDAYKKLNSWRWEVVSKGIFELTQMEVIDSYSLITRFINDKRSTIRKQAEIATVSLKEEGINYFLDHTRYKISEWQQLKLLDVVRNKTDYEPPAFRLWLTSKNNHVVLFALRLIKYYNQNDASASLIQLLRHRDNHIKKEAIFCIRDFNVTDAVPVLTTIFWKCTTDVKMYVLEALSQLGTDDDIGFLEDVVTKEVAFTVKGKAITALNTIRPEGVLPTKDIVPTADFETELEILDATIPVPIETNIHSSEEQLNLQDIPERAETVSIDTKQNAEYSLDIKPMEISFLPIVTEDLAEIVVKAEENSTKEKEHYTDIRELLVYFEEIIPLSGSEELHFEFLPIVTGDPLSEKKAEQLLHELPVTFEEVIVVDEIRTEKNKPEKNKTEKCLTSQLRVSFEEVIVPLSSVVENHKLEEDVKAKLNIGWQVEKINFSDTIPTEAISHIKVIYDVLTLEKTFIAKESIPEIDWNSAFEFETIVQSQAAITKNENEMEKELWDIPKPLFYDDVALNTIALLEDISEMGDYREIPHLNMLFQQETNAIVKARITELIASFSGVDDTLLLFEPTMLPERQSVFHNLFEVSDIEAKIILLDEIAEVGDEQEIPLLEKLILSNDLDLQKSAKRALEKLTSRLAPSKVTNVAAQILVDETPTMFSPNANNIFTVDFELAPVSEVKQKKTIPHQPTNPNDGNTLFDHLCAMSTNLYDKE